MTISRLGLFLFTRILKDGKDKRFDKAKESPLTFMVFWTLQGNFNFVNIFPTFITQAWQEMQTKINKYFIFYRCLDFRHSFANVDA